MKISWRHSIFFWYSILCLLLSSFSCHTFATSDIDKLENSINYAFANYLGTGIYTATDRNVQIYHLPFSKDITKSEKDNPFIFIRLPVTVGFLEFTPQEILDNGLPNRLETITFVPGIGIHYQVSKQWRLTPFIDIGFGHDFATNQSALVYGTGVKSRFIFDYIDYEIEIHNELLYAGNSVKTEAKTNDFSRFETGLNFRYPMSFKLWERKTAVSLYVINFNYFNSLDFIRFNEEKIQIRTQNEIGITFDTFPDMAISKIEFSRVGLAYRNGNGVNIIRLVFGMPF